MSRPGPDLSPYELAVHYQTEAANPLRDIFVSANAGSGKTHVLVNRVSRILLSAPDVKPDHILCLTYTKAAASEMQTRLFKTLGEWSVLPEARLRKELATLYNLDPSEDLSVDLKQARQLFAQALETPEGLKVQTIHAFCERLLARFPIEAGILPGFDPLDDNDAKALFDGVWRELLERAHADPDSDLARALSELIGTHADKTIDGLRAWMASHVVDIEAWVDGGGVEPLRARLGLKAVPPMDAYKTQLWAGVDKADLKSACLAIIEAEKKQQLSGMHQMLSALEEPDPVKAFDLYLQALLTTTGSIKSSFGGKGISPAVDRIFGAGRSLDTPEMMRMAEALEVLKSLDIVRQTESIFTIAQHFVRAYQQAKTAQRVLDFSDQIHLVKRLLTQSHISEWVRYKLDMGIKHILVDEAQDTAPVQWDIIDALSEAFAHDDKDAHLPRTLFAVGDEKQSIYSFQGADPTVFIEKSKTDPALDRDTQTTDKTVRLRMSFRSAPAVLEVVDQLFVDEHGLQAMFNSDYVAPASDLITHTARRKIAGQVELWPLSPPPEATQEELPWDPRPVDADAQDSAREKLARKIAQQIKDWLDRGEPVTARRKTPDGQTEDFVRPMRAGDILILVRKRSGPFFNAVIRHLKRADVPVAGADRLVLSESLAVQDLMSLARFACLPGDDLALAEVLKCPLFNLTEEPLFDIAYGREGRLWKALQDSTAPWAKRAANRLHTIIRDSQTLAPYEFFARVLHTLEPDGQSTLQNFYTRMSMEAEDPIQAFLDKALAHQRQDAPSLQHFIQSFATDRQDLKREMDDAQNQVRVMTVYGAKGLEAPVVILPDTTQVPDTKNASDNGMMALQEGGFVRAVSKSNMPAALAQDRDARTQAANEEYMRLLYVAMTRAESRLLVCGYFSGNASGKKSTAIAPEGSWHDWVARAMQGMDGVRPLTTPFDTDEGTSGLVYGQAAVLSEVEGAGAPPDETALPSWISKTCLPPERASFHVTPSHLLAPPPGLDAPLRSPLLAPVPVYRRGVLIHKLLELLPDLNTDEREAAALAFLAAHQDLSQRLRDDIFAVVFAVLNADEFSEIFAPGTRAEVSLAGRAEGLPDTLYLNAQIDRLAVTDSCVFIIDYKSNRPPPTRPEDVSPSYLGQMAAYREMARTLYPDKAVQCGLLWTDGPNMMILPDALLDAAVTQIPTG